MSMTIMLALMLSGDAASAMRCDGQLVRPGATKLEVLSKCGEPALRERVSGENEPSREAWIYANEQAGSQRILYFDGVDLSEIRSGVSPGWKPGSADLLRCGNDIIAPGATKLDVRERCGEPALTEQISGSDEQRREAWLYRRQDSTVKLQFEGVRLVEVTRLPR